MQKKSQEKKSDFLFNFIYEEKKKMKKIFFPLQMYEFCTMKEKRNIKFHKSQNHLWFSSLCQLTLAPASSANVKLYRRAYNRYIIIIFFWRKNLSFSLTLLFSSRFNLISEIWRLTVVHWFLSATRAEGRRGVWLPLDVLTKTLSIYFFFLTSINFLCFRGLCCSFTK